MVKATGIFEYLRLYSNHVRSHYYHVNLSLCFPIAQRFTFRYLLMYLPSYWLSHIGDLWAFQFSLDYEPIIPGVLPAAFTYVIFGSFHDLLRRVLNYGGASLSMYIMFLCICCVGLVDVWILCCMSVKGDQCSLVWCCKYQNIINHISKSISGILRFLIELFSFFGFYLTWYHCIWNLLMGFFSTLMLFHRPYGSDRIRPVIMFGDLNYLIK